MDSAALSLSSEVIWGSNSSAFDGLGDDDEAPDSNLAFSSITVIF